MFRYAAANSPRAVKKSSKLVDMVTDPLLMKYKFGSILEQRHLGITPPKKMSRPIQCLHRRCVFGLLIAAVRIEHSCIGKDTLKRN